MPSRHGYTLMLAISANAINASLYDNLNFNFIRDIAPVASISTIPLVMEVNPSVPAHTIPEFVDYAKANPGKINMASGGTGSLLHVAGELFKMMAGVDMIHVPYRSEALALPDLISGQVQMMFGVMPASLGYISRETASKCCLDAVSAAKTAPRSPWPSCAGAQPWIGACQPLPQRLVWTSRPSAPRLHGRALHPRFRCASIPRRRRVPRISPRTAVLLLHGTGEIWQTN